jgi:NAD(P)-dependent dehydrogenase (short-subunit alcohol dehydrogenase family)
MACGMLADKTIVIIGGTSGFGLAGARACVREGARVVLVGRDAARAAAASEALGPSTTVVVGDARDPTLAAAAIAGAIRRWGRLDGLYHVAGGSGRARGDGALDEVSDEGWGFTIDLNLNTLAWSNRAALRQFLAQKSGGSILNMSSVLGYSPSPRFFSTHAYAAAKAGVIGLSLAIAAHYAPRSIRCNVIAPAVTDTAMARRACSSDVIRGFLATKQPLDGGRVGVAEDADAAVVFFLSDASRFVTGQVLAVDGGWSVSEGGSAPEGALPAAMEPIP